MRLFSFGPRDICIPGGGKKYFFWNEETHLW